MLGFRKARTPLSTFQRVDIELLMRRTIDELGLPFVRKTQILTDLSQLDLLDDTQQALVDSATKAIRTRFPEQQLPCDVQIVPGADIGYPSIYVAASNEASAMVRIAEETCEDPLRTVMELAFQFSAHYWHGVPGATELDKSPRNADLMPICCGFGVLGSEACLYDDQWSQAGWAGWSISRSGYYSTVEIGYALALLARCRNETSPDWDEHLRLDSRETAALAWKFFASQEKLGRSLLFDAETIPSTQADMSQLATWLSGPDPAYALAAGYALAKLNDLSPLAVESAIKASRSSDPDVVPLAVRVLGKARTCTPELERCVMDLCRKGKPRVAVAAMQAAVELNLSLIDCRRRLVKLFDYFAGDPSPILDLIGSQGHALKMVAPRVMPRLVLAVRDQDSQLVDSCLRCMIHIGADVEGLISKYLKVQEPRDQALQRLAELKDSGAG